MGSFVGSDDHIVRVVVNRKGNACCQSCFINRSFRNRLVYLFVRWFFFVRFFNGWQMAFLGRLSNILVGAKAQQSVSLDMLCLFVCLGRRDAQGLPASITNDLHQSAERLQPFRSSERGLRPAAAHHAAHARRPTLHRAAQRHQEHR